ncbi:MAG: hypothetical protein Ct9H300mP7_6200 [Verrucomicrobiota bacterium]|nr:MAG: hypothetical protein Ct9H300mP7_6200 [Verrucomicrobiota bacterium]
MFDIYHVQIMHGDIIRNIRTSRNTSAITNCRQSRSGELDDTQEINYPAVMRAILATGFKGLLLRSSSPPGTKRAAALQHAAEVGRVAKRLAVREFRLSRAPFSLACCFMRFIREFTPKRRPPGNQPSRLSFFLSRPPRARRLFLTRPSRRYDGPTGLALSPTAPGQYP